MTCREVVDFLVEYLSNTLPPGPRRVFEQHVAGCQACAAYLESYKETVALGKAAFEHPDDEVPEEVPEDLVQAILEARKK